MAENNGTNLPSEVTETPENPAARLRELENLPATRDAEIDTLKSAVGEMKTRLENACAERAVTLEGYRTLLVSQHPEITPEMIRGESITALDEALTKARSLTAKVRQSVLQELALNRIPVGAPGRQTPDLSALSPREKINYGVGGKQ